MKPLFIILTVLSSLFVTNTYAGENDVTPVVLQSFKHSFRSAKEVAWSANNTYYKADFQLDDQYISAYYNANGELLALIRNISSVQLPLTLQTSLKNNYQDYWISDLFEIASNDTTTYYVTLENGDKKIVLKSDAGNWYSYKKINKV